MSRVIVTAVALFLLVLAGCGSDRRDEPEPTSTGEPSASATATPVGSPVAASPRCADASLVSPRIAEGLSVPGGVLVDAFAVPLVNIHADFIAAEVDGPGWESPGDVMVWYMDDTGAIYSVNASAKEFSTWPDGAQADPALSMDTADAREAEFCAERPGFG